MFRTPFKDAIEKSPVPTKGTGSGEYDKQEMPNTPSKSGNAFPALHRDTTFDGPKGTGPITRSPFKDAIEK